MNKTLYILKNEFLVTVSRRSFLLTLILVPLVSLGITIFISNTRNGSPSIIDQIVSSPQKVPVEGFVDESGIIKLIPTWSEPAVLISYSDRLSASQALYSGKITGFYVILKDYVSSGRVLYFRNEFSPLSGVTLSYTFEELIHFNLLDGNQALTSLVENPINELQTTSLDTNLPQREQSNALTFILPYIVTMFFYFLILTAASLMLNSVTTEKQNRMIEILMASVSPTQMLTGKIIALGLVGLLQTIVWMGAGYGLLVIGKTSLNLSAFQLPISFLLWGIVFFILGYALYGSLMAGVGALVPGLREASQATTVMIIPLIIPLILLNVLINDPNGILSTLLSIFPLTAPVTMMTRLSIGNVPIWQPFLAVLLLSTTVYLVIRGVAGMFRAQTLLQGQTFNLRVFMRALVDRG